MNNVSLIGRLTKDVELRTAGKGKNAVAVSNFTLAVENPFKKDEDGNTTADFIKVTVFGGTAEFCDKYLEKGTRIGLVGRISTGSYEHEDGHTVYTTEVIANNIYFADAPKEKDNKSKSKKK